MPDTTVETTLNGKPLFGNALIWRSHFYLHLALFAAVIITFFKVDTESVAVLHLVFTQATSSLVQFQQAMITLQEMAVFKISIGLVDLRN